MELNTQFANSIHCNTVTVENFCFLMRRNNDEMAFSTDGTSLPFAMLHSYQLLKFYSSVNLLNQKQCGLL